MTASAAEATPPIVVVGASAGGVEALRELVSGLPADLAACVLVVLHVPPDYPTALPAILRRAGPLKVDVAADGELLAPGLVLVAPPNHHLLVLGGTAALSHGPQENGHRPTIDVLFRSAARAHGDRVLGVVLSGTLDDGAAGAARIEAEGGRVVVQDLGEALYANMPRAAAGAAKGAAELSVTEMGPWIAEWARETAASGAPAPASSVDDQEVAVANLDPRAMHDPERVGVPAGFGCPDCAGALYQIDEGGLRRYRCRVGHAWSPESLLARQGIAMESALWMALRSLEEKAALNGQLGARADERGQLRTAVRFREGADEATRAAELVRQLIDELDAVGRWETPAGEA